MPSLAICLVLVSARCCSVYYPAAEISDGPTDTLSAQLANPYQNQSMFPQARKSLDMRRVLRLVRGKIAKACKSALKCALQTLRTTYLILVSLKSTCLRATGSYFLNTIFSVEVRGFFLVT